jgi:hypothetical protein
MVISIDAIGGRVNDVQEDPASPIERPTINFIQGSNVGIVVADDVGNDRVNVTISGQALGLSEVFVGRGTVSGGNTIPLNANGSSSDNTRFAIAVVGWNDSENSVSIGGYSIQSDQNHTLAFGFTTGSWAVSTNKIGRTFSGGSTAVYQSQGSGADPRIVIDAGSNLMTGWGMCIRVY